jgi:hypothetical protein
MQSNALILNCLISEITWDTERIGGKIQATSSGCDLIPRKLERMYGRASWGVELSDKLSRLKIHIRRKEVDGRMHTKPFANLRKYRFSQPAVRRIRPSGQLVSRGKLFSWNPSCHQIESISQTEVKDILKPCMDFGNWASKMV